MPNQKSLIHMSEEKLTYEKAVGEIEEILQKIEQGEMGVDELTKKVERATRLLKWCRERLYQTGEQVEKILSDD